MNVTKWHCVRLSGFQRDDVQEFAILDHENIPVFYRSNFGTSGESVHLKPNHAALITAAPELLELARRYASECGHCNGTGILYYSPENDCNVCSGIRALIAKAGG